MTTRATSIKSAAPSTPVTVLGLNEVPDAGEVFERVKNDRDAKRIVEERISDADRAAQVPAKRVSLEDLFARIDAGEIKTLNLIVRADMQGTLEPVVNSLKRSGQRGESRSRYSRQRSAISPNRTLCWLKPATPSSSALAWAWIRPRRYGPKPSGVEIRRYSIIYKMIEDVEDAITGMLEPIYENFTIGHALVLKLFKLRRGTIAGCQVQDGIVKRNAPARVLRNNTVVIDDTKVDTLRRFEEDVAEVRAGFECGIKLADSWDLQENDVIEILERRRVR